MEPAQLDILKEVGNIAGSHGSVALSEILGTKINISVPTVSFIYLDNPDFKKDLSKTSIIVSSKIISGLKGRVALLLDEDNAFKLIDLSCKVKNDNKMTGLMTEMGMSFIKELGGIIMGAYVTSLSMMFRKVILLHPPVLASGSLDDLVNIVFSLNDSKDYILLVEVNFEEPKDHIKGSFFLVLTPDAAMEIQERCQILLNENNDSGGK